MGACQSSTKKKPSKTSNSKGQNTGQRNPQNPNLYKQTSLQTNQSFVPNQPYAHRGPPNNSYYAAPNSSYYQQFYMQASGQQPPGGNNFHQGASYYQQLQPGNAAKANSVWMKDSKEGAQLQSRTTQEAVVKDGLLNRDSGRKKIDEVNSGEQLDYYPPAVLKQTYSISSDGEDSPQKKKKNGRK